MTQGALAQNRSPSGGGNPPSSLALSPATSVALGKSFPPPLLGLCHLQQEGVWSGLLRRPYQSPKPGFWAPSNAFEPPDWKLVAHKR